MTSTKSKPAQSENSVKVAPYPIAISILRSEGMPLLAGAILKLTDVGFLMRVDETQFYKVAETLQQVSFELPVLGTRVRSAGKVVKTYDGLESMTKAGLKKMKTIEVHFLNLSDENKRNIHSFLVKSGQSKS